MGYYSDLKNDLGKLEGSFEERIQINTLNDNYLMRCVQTLKNSGSYAIFGGGDRARQLIDVFHEKFQILPSVILMSKKYMREGKVFRSFAGLEFPIKPYEEYAKENPGAVVVLGIPKGTMPNEVLENKNIRLVEFSFSMSALGYEQYYSPSYIKEHLAEYSKVYGLLEDRYSQDAYFENIYSRVTGENIDFPKAPWSDPPYFLEDLMEWREEEVLVDGGAYIGDTVDEFLNKMPSATQKYRVYSYEPEAVNCKLAIEKFADNPNIHWISKGMWSGKDTLKFGLADGESGVITDKGTIYVEVDSIDNVLGSDKATFIKMDIEGSEFEALKGARNQIVQNKPRLAICLYHKPEDMYEIPLYIHSLNPNYKFYVRPHSSMPSELVLFCV